MRAIAFGVTSLLVLGFYGYLLSQFYREYKRFHTHEKRLHEHPSGMGAKRNIMVTLPERATLPNVPKHVRKETLIDIAVAIGGLLGVFTEIGFLNRVVGSFH